ncbi:transmembrane protein 33-like [Amphibalanus amphitrite]|nr:transmembrane protein 33-like [Amphibalanus amphitrite]XP_043235475.1 transmembrane protein 33-like [Amphibalanus amphitrite]
MDGGADGGQAGGGAAAGGQQTRTTGVDVVREHISANKVTFALFCTRVAQILFAIGFVIPLFGSAANAFSKCLVATVATSALRLHQRVPQLQLSRQFLATLMAEDACHYLFFALIFLYSSPTTLVLVPPTLFAVLHAASYALRLLDMAGQNNSIFSRYLMSLEFQSQNILRAVALFEIILMPYTIIMLFTGRGSLLTPFVYYRFLSLRYSSYRNPYSRTMFHELRRMAETQAASPSCPALVATLLRRGVTLTLSLSPAPAAAPAQ